MIDRRHAVREASPLDATSQDAMRAATSASPGDSAPPEAAEEHIADLDDGYELLGEIGRGGSAIVFQARDRNLGRAVAIKVVRPRFGADDEAIARLAREARTVAQLEHPNIVTVHEVRRLRDGGLALVMQLVPGRTLKATVQEDGPLPVDMVERVIRDVASALAFAHAHGVVHRDVKPENIFLDRATGRAMLSDFGIAHSQEFDSRLTMTGTAIGTPAYMAPEQIDGAPADARSDVYSLGLVAWEMLTGRRPWDGESLYSVIYKQKHDELPPIDAMRSGVPLRLQYIVERMLQKRPAARWAGADGLLGHMNASVLPADWSQWQDAHRRRAKARDAAPKQGFVSAALATIRFRRPTKDDGTPDDSALPPVAASAVSAAATSSGSIPGSVRGAPSAPGHDAEDPDDPRPSWVRAPAPRRNARRLVPVIGVLALVASAALGLALRDGDTVVVSGDIPSLGEGSAVAVPVLPESTIARLAARDSAVTATLDSMSAAGALVDSASAKAYEDSIVAAAAAAALAAAAQPSMTAGPSRIPAMGAQVVEARPLVRAGVPTLVPDNPAIPPAPRTNPMTVPPIAAAPSPSSSSLAATESMLRSTDDRAIIAAGGRHSCVLDGGRVACWGGNEAGQLGDGDLEARATPAGIAGEIDIAAISAGIAHSCGVSRGGDAFCWGSNDRGQLGDATTTSRSAPVRVGGSAIFRTVRAGLAHSCGLSVSGLVLCWGANASGQVGDGSASTRLTPVQIATSTRFISVTAGWNHSCAIAVDGTAYCWGDNSAGQLGNGSRTSQRSPVVVGGDVRFTSISAGTAHTCAVAENGDAYCWGRNSYGQLGTGGGGDRLTPVRVGGVTFASVSVGGVHSCGRTRGGAAFCWGRNTYGQIGDGSTVDRDTPTRVAGGLSFGALNATGAHTCGVTTDGVTMCWGYNVDGQLGDGTRSHRARPVRVAAAGER